jgi:diguanylate cyclase (GGDEF)-like protein
VALDAELPQNTAELRAWLKSRLNLDPSRQALVEAAVDEVVSSQRQLLEESKHDAIKALSSGFAEKLSELQVQLTEKDATVNNIARYFEEIVADLTEKSHRDPKTKLLNYDWFMERLESALAIEQRVRWCGIGVVDINSFKSYNDTLGHAVGDRIIERVAMILAEQIRGEDLLTLERRSRDLHARFGGDEFCFLIPDLPGCDEGATIAERFKRAVERFDWARESPGLADRPVKVDVGIVCLHLGPVAERRGIARPLANDLIQLADKLMYEAKHENSRHVRVRCVRLRDGALVDAVEGHAVRHFREDSDSDRGVATMLRLPIEKRG